MSRSSLRAAVPSTAATPTPGTSGLMPRWLAQDWTRRHGALAAAARQRHAVDLVQLADQLQLDRHHGDGLGGQQHGRGEQGRRDGPLDRGDAAAGRADRRRWPGPRCGSAARRARRRPGRGSGGAGWPGRGPARAGRRRRPCRPSSAARRLGRNRSAEPRRRTCADQPGEQLAPAGPARCRPRSAPRRWRRGRPVVGRSVGRRSGSVGRLGSVARSARRARPTRSLLRVARGVPPVTRQAAYPPAPHA